MNLFGKQLSAGTQQLAQQAVFAAQAAGASLVAGLRTCDERSGGSLSQFEIRIDPDSGLYGSKRLDIPVQLGHRLPNANSIYTYPDSSIIQNLLHAVSIPSTAMAFRTGNNDKNGTITDQSNTCTTWGSHTFEFNLKLVEIGPSAGCLVASAKRKNNQLDEPVDVPIRCRWRRKFGGQIVDICGVYGTEYPISADDVASQIIVEATALDSHGKDIAYAEMGPFELDASYRRHLDDYLAIGGARFPIRLRNVLSLDSTSNSHSHSGTHWNPSFKSDSVSGIDQEEEFILDISSEEIKLIKPGPKHMGYDQERSCRFGGDCPSIQLSYVDFITFELKLNPSEKLVLLATTRSQRDLITLCIRCFHARQWIANSLLLQQAVISAGKLSLSGGPAHRLTDSSTMSEQLCIDVFAVLQRLNAELKTCLENQEKSMKERDRAQIEKDALEEDIAATIGAYQQLLLTQGPTDTITTNGGQTQSIALEITQRAAYVAELETKIKEYQKDAEQHLSEIELLRRDYKDLQTTIQTQPDTSFFSNRSSQLNSMNLRSTFKSFDHHVNKQTTESLHYTVQDVFKTDDLRQQIQTLQQTHQQLLNDYTLQKKEMETMQFNLLSQSSTVNESHGNSSLFNKSLRTQLHHAVEKKEELEKELLLLRHENKELSENFLYIKSKHDTFIQEKQQDRSTVHIHDIKDTPNNQDIQQITALQHALDQSEKKVQQLQGDLNASTTEKNRILKKVEVLNKDLEKSQQQFETKAKTLMNLNKQLTADKALIQDQLSKNDDKQEKTITPLQTKVVGLEKEVSEKTDMIERLQKENETLRSRIRKLATDPK